MFSFLYIIRSGRLAEIRWSIWMSKSHRCLCVSFSRTDSGLCIYHLFVLLLLLLLVVVVVVVVYTLQVWAFDGIWVPASFLWFHGLCIFANHNNVVKMVSILPLIFCSSNPLFNLWRPIQAPKVQLMLALFACYTVFVFLFFFVCFFIL